MSHYHFLTSRCYRRLKVKKSKITRMQSKNIILQRLKLDLTYGLILQEPKILLTLSLLHMYFLKKIKNIIIF